MNKADFMAEAVPPLKSKWWLAEDPPIAGVNRGRELSAVWQYAEQVGHEKAIRVLQARDSAYWTIFLKHWKRGERGLLSRLEGKVEAEDRRTSVQGIRDILRDMAS